MTRKRFNKLCMALSIRISEKHGNKVNGKMLRLQKANAGYDKLLAEFGSYEAVWEWMKPVREAYGMD